MTKTRLYIHVGTHKTGSSTIQHTLHQNRIALRKEGVVYLTLPRAIRRLMTCEELDGDIIRSLRKELNRQIISNQQKQEENIRFLISFEGFSGNPLIGYRNTGTVANNLRKITDNMNVSIIIYLRRQDDFVESLYGNKIRDGKSYSFQSFVETFTADSFDWERLLSCYAKHFSKGSVVARRYDKVFLPESDSLLRDFFQVIGIDSQNILSTGGVLSKYRGYSRDTLEIARLCNPYLNSDEKRSLRRILKHTSPKNPFERNAFWSCEKREEFLNRYSESNANVANKYFNESSGVLFPISDTYSEHKVYQGLSLEAVVPVLVKAIVAQQQTHTQSIALRVFMKVERKMITLLSKFPWLKSKLLKLYWKMRL